MEHVGGIVQCHSMALLPFSLRAIHGISTVGEWGCHRYLAALLTGQTRFYRDERRGPNDLLADNTGEPAMMDECYILAVARKGKTKEEQNRVHAGSSNLKLTCFVSL
jgi:hypothetical protein